MKKLNVALLGNPNCGKTTLFNALTGGKQHVGNWAGVTVEKKEGEFEYNGQQINIIDLPGIYSLSTKTIEEKVSRNYLIEEKPDLVINIIDGTNLEKSLYLTTQLMELGIKFILAINMYDEVKSKGIKIDIKKLSKFLNVPVIPIIARNETGIDLLKSNITSESTLSKAKVGYDEDIENAIESLLKIIKKDKKIEEKINIRWLIIELLEGDPKAFEMLKNSIVYDEVKNTLDDKIEYVKKIYNEEIKIVIMEKRFGFILGLIKECVIIRKMDFSKLDITEKIDNIILNKWVGLPLFLFILWGTFNLTFVFGNFFSSYINDGIVLLGNFVSNVLPNGILKDMLIDGAIGGMGGILVFLPQILILFLVIALLEDSGYMARVAFIMDKLMHYLGLHGKSFISLFMGFGCNVPGIMAARILENEDDRIVTALVNPFMSCSARLPIYILVTGMFFKKNAGNVIFSIYLIGIIVAIFTAKMLKKFFFKGLSVPFVMELPPYRAPTLKSLMIHMWDRASMFLKKMGGVILIGALIVWALGYFPINKNYSNNIVKLETQASKITDIQKKNDLSMKIEDMKKVEDMENSYMGKIGKTIEPVFKPLGITWREGVALIAGITAKEIFVSTISVLYGVGDENATGLKRKMLKDGITPIAAYGLMVFVLLYIPCVATIAAIRRETNSLKWTIFSVIYGISIAYALSFLINTIGKSIFY
ncbi:ferrous iron transport protein B [Haliovirga abyssi]|uniref:Ferrous iron transport protein B n=1 Tax=Haliovirga abyssi TaxID=2996794 RepID=A0AAU9DDH1_9FUSO|nr:ferrous iron transport protein B [Haliovirga abyssi]BDU50372.1 ferrous iron transport protein B [Haliovirga abyssi]